MQVFGKLSRRSIPLIGVSTPATCNCLDQLAIAIAIASNRSYLCCCSQRRYAWDVCSTGYRTAMCIGDSYGVSATRYLVEVLVGRTGSRPLVSIRGSATERCQVNVAGIGTTTRWINTWDKGDIQLSRLRDGFAVIL